MRRAAPSAMPQPGVPPAFRADSSRAQKRPRDRAPGTAAAVTVGVTFHDGGLMGKPVVLLADGSQARGRVETELCKRYGTDYRVITTGSAQEALEALGKLRDGQRQVSLVLAGQWLQDATGAEL